MAGFIEEDAAGVTFLMARWQLPTQKFDNHFFSGSAMFGMEHTDWQEDG